MKRALSLCFIVCQVCVTSHAEDVPFHRLGHAFTQTNINLVWKASTKKLPQVLWTYRAVPSNVSSTVISNVIALGAFTEKDRKKIPDYPHLVSYADSTGKKWLLINPEWASIEYRDSDACDLHTTNGVPDRQQAFKMASDWLPKLGIDGRQLFPNPNGSGTKFYGGPGTEFLYPRKGGPAYATNIFMYGVTFMRALDGVEFSGGCARGGGEIEFGHEAKIYTIHVFWRNYQHDKLYRTATRKQVLHWIREGKAVWYSADSPFVDLSSVKNITIKKATPYYYSEAYGQDDQPQNAAYPFLEMEAIASTGKTNMAFDLDCPIIDQTEAIPPRTAQ